MNSRTGSLVIGLTVCYGMAAADEKSSIRLQAPAIGVQQRSVGKAPRGGAGSGKISRGKLFCRLSRAVGRAWIVARTDGPRRPAPSADDDPFPEGEPSEPIQDEGTPR